MSVRSGEFAKEWMLENAVGRPEYRMRRQIDAAHPIEVVGRRLRAMMKWLQ